MEASPIEQCNAARREHVMNTLERLAAIAEARGDVKTALRAIVYLGRICGAFRAAKPTAGTAPQSELPAKAPVKMYSSKNKYEGILLDEPIRPPLLAAA